MPIKPIDYESVSKVHDWVLYMSVEGLYMLLLSARAEKELAKSTDCQPV